MHLLEEREYSTLRDLCKHYLPRSIILFNMLSIKLASDLHMSASQPLEVFVDHWPNPAVAVLKTKSKWGNITDYPILCAFSLDGNLGTTAAADTVQPVLRDACKDHNGFILNFWPLAGVGTLRNAIKRMAKGKLNVKMFASTRTFWIPPADHEKLYRRDPELPEGFFYDELLPEEAELVDSLWVHRFHGSVDYVRRFITTMPNVCVRSSDGKLAGFSMVHGLLGNEVHLYTMPEFRRQKLAFNIERILARKVLLSGLLPCKYVVPSNYEAMQMTLNSPFWKETNEEFAWLQVCESRD